MTGGLPTPELPVLLPPQVPRALPPVCGAPLEPPLPPSTPASLCWGATPLHLQGLPQGPAPSRPGASAAASVSPAAGTGCNP